METVKVADFNSQDIIAIAIIGLIIFSLIGYAVYQAQKAPMEPADKARGFE